MFVIILEKSYINVNFAVSYFFVVMILNIIELFVISIFLFLIVISVE